MEHALRIPHLIYSNLNKLPSFPTVRNERDRESLGCLKRKIPDISSLDSGMTIRCIDMEHALRISHLVYPYLLQHHIKQKPRAARLLGAFLST